MKTPSELSAQSCWLKPCTNEMAIILKTFFSNKIIFFPCMHIVCRKQKAQFKIDTIKTSGENALCVRIIYAVKMVITFYVLWAESSLLMLMMMRRRNEICASHHRRQHSTRNKKKAIQNTLNWYYFWRSFTPWITKRR